jgi:hypothetical protein
VQITVEKCLENGVQIPNNKDDMVELAFSKGWVKSAEDQQESNSQLPES